MVLPGRGHGTGGIALVAVDQHERVGFAERAADLAHDVNDSPGRLGPVLPHQALQLDPQVNVTAAPGFGSRDAMNALERTFALTMPGEMGYDYAGMSFQEKRAQEGVPPAVIFVFSLLFVGFGCVRSS